MVFVNQYFAPDEAATAQLLSDLVEAAAGDGHECRVVAADRGYADPSVRYPRRERWRGADVSRVRTTGFGRSSALGRAVDYLTFLLGALREIVFGGRADVVVGLSTPPILGALAVVAARLKGCRSAYWAMDVYPDLAFELGALRRRSLVGRVLSAVSRWTLARADLVVALGECMAATLEQRGGRPAVTIHNWADGASIRPLGPEESRVRAGRGWSGKLVVLYSGNLGLAHEFETLLDAANVMRDESGVVFAFCGTGPARAGVEAAVRARGLENVEFHPAVRRSELGELLGAGDVHVVTLRPGLEGLLVPSKFYGILAAGRPVLYVGPRAGEVYDLVSSSGCGRCVRPGEVGELVAALRAWKDDVGMRSHEGLLARRLFEARFTRAGQTARLASVIQALAEGRTVSA